MLDFLTVGIAVLAVLAVMDLSFGVSNDAVNFLNSAVGSQVASPRVILIVASCGVLVGAMFSSGMMEVARSGIFKPEMFTFADLMVVFLAVMIADVLLLDVFNTFGLPTSTTVSLVFELLGAATAVAILLSLDNPSGPQFFAYINGRNALTIVSGIVMSVVLAFFLGAVVQFISRLLFTFDLERRRLLRIGWSGFALTLISDFLLIKGMKGTTFLPSDWLVSMQTHTWPLLAALFALWLIVAAVIDRSGRNPLAFVVLAGTFSLAMAFASNDLVNFIGVPLAGLEGWKIWLESGVAADALLMDALREPVHGANGYLFAAGLVMVATLWLSAKARTVTQTEVRLARQAIGSERFRPGPISRRLVHASLLFGEGLRVVTPAPWRTDIARRFSHPVEPGTGPDQPAFDLLRASVNLAVASILIALATSLKLPLSTTFVTFMVAMGTSLADRAWGRDSAAYRVAGVLAVLTGWFVTAAVAFLLAAAFAVLLRLYELSALVVLAVFVAFALYRTYRYHGSRLQTELRSRAAESALFGDHVQLLSRQLSGLLQAGSEIIDLALRGLIARDWRSVERARDGLTDLKALCGRKELSFVRLMKRLQPTADETLAAHLRVLACQQDFYQTVQTVVEIARSHVVNSHEPLSADIHERLGEFNVLQRSAIEAQVRAWDGDGDPAGVESQLRMLDDMLHDLTRKAVGDLYADRRPVKHTALLLTLASELGDIVRELERAHLLRSAVSGESAADRSEVIPPAPQPAP
jgi:phosphate/sulfate permease